MPSLQELSREPSKRKSSFPWGPMLTTLFLTVFAFAWWRSRTPPDVTLTAASYPAPQADAVAPDLPALRQPTMRLPPPTPVTQAAPAVIAVLPASPPTTVAEKRPEPTGAEAEAALVEALRDRKIRLAGPLDVSEWIGRQPPAAQRKFQEYLRPPIYVIESGGFEIPDGLYGAHSVVFILPSNVPFPRGKLGHSTLLDMASGGCQGTACMAIQH